MPDLVGHDRQPSAFLVYLTLWRQTPRGRSSDDAGCAAGHRGSDWALEAFGAGCARTTRQAQADQHRAREHHRRAGLYGPPTLETLNGTAPVWHGGPVQHVAQAFRPARCGRRRGTVAQAFHAMPFGNSMSRTLVLLRWPHVAPRADSPEGRQLARRAVIVDPENPRSVRPLALRGGPTNLRHRSDQLAPSGMLGARG